MPVRRPAREPGQATQVIDEPTVPLPQAPQPPPPFGAQLEEPPPGRDLWPWLGVLLVLVVAGLLGAWLGWRQGHGPTPKTAAAPPQTVAPSVPDVTGQQEAAAVATLEAVGLRAHVVRVPSDQPTGQVVAQHPAPGASAQGGSAVRLNVSTGPSESAASSPAGPTVPDVRGEKFSDARKELRAAGFATEIERVPSALPKNSVVGQSPGPGASAQQSDHVLLTVSGGANKKSEAGEDEHGRGHGPNR